MSQLSPSDIFGELEAIDQRAPLSLVEFDDEQRDALSALRSGLLDLANADGKARDAARRKLKIAFEHCQRRIPTSLRADPKNSLGRLLALAEVCCR